MRAFHIIVWGGLVIGVALLPLATAQETITPADLDRVNQEGFEAYDAADYQTAVQHWQAGLNQARALNDKPYISQFLTNLGSVYQDLEQYPRALEYYEQALAIHRELGNWRGEGVTLTNLGNVYANLGQYQDASIALQESLRLHAALGTLDSLWLAQRGLAAVEVHLNQFESAIVHYEQALDTIEALRAGLTEKAQKLSFMQDKLFVYDALITLLHDLHHKHPEKEYDRKALEIFERKQGRIFLEEMGQSGARLFAGLPESITQQERDLERQLEQTRTQLVDERSKIITEQNKELIHTLEAHENTLHAERAALQERIKTKYPDYYALKYPKPVALAELQTKVLRPGELMLVYGVMQEKTYLWLIGQDKFGLYTLDSGEDDLAQQVAALRAALHDAWGTERGLILPGTTDKPSKPRQPVAQLSHALYTLLIPEAVRAALTDQDALIIVPTGPLYALPFELLLTHPATTLQEAQYLIEAHPISYLSSASLLHTLREAYARRTSTARYPLLAFAHPAYRREAVQASDRVRALRSHSYRTFLGGEFTELPETADETSAIADVLKAPHDSDALQLRAKASRANVLAFNTQNRLDDYHYLIFAMHGVLPDEVSQVTQSALVLSDDFLTMADVFGLRLNAKLVSLSACNTGRGTQVKGEGVMGLTRAFMYAGTPAVAVTLWSVESLSAKDLDIGFFRHLSTGLSPAKALQAIKVQMLQGALGKAYRHPYYWAPFVLFGDGL